MTSRHAPPVWRTVLGGVHGEATMLELVPRFGMSQRFSVRLDGEEVADVALGWFREGGDLTIAGVHHELRRERLASGAFQLLHDGHVLAEARKPSAFFDRFQVEHDGRRYELAKARWWARRFELREHGQVVGTIAPRHVLTNRCELALPPDLPLPVQVFLAALAVLMWNRDANAAASGGGAT